MKKIALSFILCFNLLSANAQYILSSFTVCNEMSYPIYFTAWALDRPDSNRWSDWIPAGDCRTDQFDKYYDSALYEFSVGPFEAPFKDYILREGETYTISPFNP
jgi:hypothetical protein